MSVAELIVIGLLSVSVVFLIRSIIWIREMRNQLKMDSSNLETFTTVVDGLLSKIKEIEEKLQALSDDVETNYKEFDDFQVDIESRVRHLEGEW